MYKQQNYELWNVSVKHHTTDDKDAKPELTKLNKIRNVMMTEEQAISLNSRISGNGTAQLYIPSGKPAEVKAEETETAEEQA